MHLEKMVMHFYKQARRELAATSRKGRLIRTTFAFLDHEYSSQLDVIASINVPAFVTIRGVKPFREMAGRDLEAEIGLWVHYQCNEQHRPEDERVIIMLPSEHSP